VSRAGRYWHYRRRYPTVAICRRHEGGSTRNRLIKFYRQQSGLPTKRLIWHTQRRDFQSEKTGSTPVGSAKEFLWCTVAQQLEVKLLTGFSFLPLVTASVVAKFLGSQRHLLGRFRAPVSNLTSL
jgi:hypothetical protein